MRHVTHSVSLGILCPFYTQKRCYISELSADRYVLSFDLEESRRPASVNGFFRGCRLFTHTHTHVRVGFSDYKLLMHAAAADNPSLL